jgi:hypothetical protein
MQRVKTEGVSEGEDLEIYPKADFYPGMNKA